MCYEIGWHNLRLILAGKDDYSVAGELYELLKDPYGEQSQHEEKWFPKTTRMGTTSSWLLNAVLLKLSDYSSSQP